MIDTLPTDRISKLAFSAYPMGRIRNPRAIRSGSVPHTLLPVNLSHSNGLWDLNGQHEEHPRLLHRNGW